MQELRKEISNILREELTGQEIALTAPISHASAEQMSQKMKPKKIRFNKGLETEYEILFSERGFLIGDTRMSFEEIENAISKEYTLTLKDGFILDAVKMQQILKYKNIN